MKDFSYINAILSFIVPPEIRLTNSKIKQRIGKETILDCEVTSNPQLYSAWTKDGRPIQNDDKFKIDLYDDYKNTLTLSLKISDIQESDFGAYRCEAQNELGRDYQDTYLYGAYYATDYKHHFV